MLGGLHGDRSSEGFSMSANAADAADYKIIFNNISLLVSFYDLIKDKLLLVKAVQKLAYSL